MLNDTSLFDVACRDILLDIEHRLNGTGLFFRIFSRVKSYDSISKKLKALDKDGNVKYLKNEKHIQDIIGIRIVAYFNDDIPIINNLLKTIYKHKEDAIDDPNINSFSATRYNIVYEIPEYSANEIKISLGALPIDSTFEVQIRSILSEGWHEIEHDLRYKRKDDWTDYKSLSRQLNGIMATLETSEWGMKAIFDELAYNHYKNKNWYPMLLNTLRLRITGEADELIDRCFENKEFCKSFLRINRSKLITSFFNNKLPLNINNIVYYWSLTNSLSDELNNSIPLLTKEMLLKD